MAREGALDDPAVPTDVKGPQKRLPAPGTPQMSLGRGQIQMLRTQKRPKQLKTLWRLQMWQQKPQIQMCCRPKNGHRMLLVDSDTDVEDEGPNPDVGPPKHLKMTQNVPETPDVGLKISNPDVPWLKNGRGTLQVESDTDVEEEEVDPDAEPPKRLKMTQNVSETPDVVAKTPNPDVSGPKTRCGMQVVDSDTDVEEDPDVPPQKRLKLTQNMPAIPDVEVETPNPAVGTPKTGHWTMLVDSDTDVEGEEENPDVQLPKQLRMTQNVPETPDVAATAPNPDVSGPKLHSRMLLLDSDTDMEEKVNLDVQPPKRLKVTQNVPRILDVGVETPNPAVERPKIGHHTLVMDSDTDVDTDPDVQPPKRLRRTQNVPKTADVRWGTPNPDVSGPTIGCQMLVDSSDIDVEEDPDVEPPKWLRGTQNVPETPDVAAKTPNPDVSGPKIGRQTFLVDSDTDVEEENPDAETLKKLEITQNVPESPDVVTQTPNPDVGVTKNGRQALLVDSDTDVEEEEGNPDVCPSRRWKNPQNMLQTPDVPTQPPSPAVEGSQRGHRALLDDSDTDVEEEASPDVGSLKRLKPAPNVPETPDVRLKTPNPDVSGTKIGWCDAAGGQRDRCDVGEAEADPDVRSPKQLQMTQKPHEIPDVEEEEESDPDVATQLFLPSPDVGSPESPKMAPKDPKNPDVEEEEDPTLNVHKRKWAGLGGDLIPRGGGANRGCQAQAPPPAAPGSAHIRVLFTGLVASPALRVALGTLGGTEATSVHDCSHLVTDGIRRTLKFLCALGRGVPIVTPQWLLESSHSGRPLSPGPFLPRDPSCERRFGFRLRPALARARERPLLQGYQVHVTPSVQPVPEDMRDIVTCCGGTFLPQLPREHAPCVLVISCPQDRWLWPPAVAARLPLLRLSCLLSGVLQQRLELAPFLLSPLAAPPAPPKHP
ncbi:LOW QUALITY PROTEIN: mediator of DNA damage checkpoint protein 1 [Vidua macroura]|uniref:LOW QUALITY PROTEIN: mediator of DNA damage checkpoint protein 1 n=1 Tax=Vidua macroura TaxID=187451 RepID=UPI0023A7FA6C|nr:LOW QUALITY PROTEIN: mediator of DNA damage checkpoint protein 1 [Vidua macroura]